MSTLPINTHLQGGAFAIGEVLGQGGFGITYHGGDMRLRRYIAIKEFFPLGSERQGNIVQQGSLLDSTAYMSAKAKFLEEARVLAQFRSPSIVQVYTFFEENNTAYMVMEFLEGKTLTRLVQERGALPEHEAVVYIEKVSVALREVHRANLLHRDLKPENVIACEDGRVVLIDFGLTKKIEQTIGLGTRRLATTTLFGSDGYAAPEQYIHSSKSGTFTDIYALGATLYYLLTGEVPISAIERMYGVDLAEVQRSKAQISQAVNDAVIWAMRIKENERPQTVREFIQALQSRTQLAPIFSAAPAMAPVTSGLVPLVPLATRASPIPKDWGECERCGESYPHSFRQCQCGATLPWAKPQVPAISQTARGVVSVGNSEGLIAAIEQASPGSTIRLLPTIYYLTSPLLIRKSLRLEGAGYNKSHIRSDAEGYVLKLEGDSEWSLQSIAFEHFGTRWANVVEAQGGRIEFHECSFKGAVEDEFNLKVRNRGGDGLRIRENTVGIIKKCDFSGNGSCGIELSGARILEEDNHYSSNKTCSVCHGYSK